MCKRLAIIFLWESGQFLLQRDNNNDACACVVFPCVIQYKAWAVVLLLLHRQSRASNEVVTDSSHASLLLISIGEL